MKVKNMSARLHHVGAVSIAPGETKEIPSQFANAISPDLVKVEEPVQVAEPKKSESKKSEPKAKPADEQQ